MLLSRGQLIGGDRKSVIWLRASSKRSWKSIDFQERLFLQAASVRPAFGAGEGGRQDRIITGFGS
jgi:hypothetical protein